MVAAALAMCLLFSFAACAKSGNDSGAEESSTVSTSVVTTASTTTTLPPTEPVSTTVVTETEAERATYGDAGVTEATYAAPKTTARATVRTTVRQTVRTTASSNDAGCIDDGAMTY